MKRFAIIISLIFTIMQGQVRTCGRYLFNFPFNVDKEFFDGEFFDDGVDDDTKLQYIAHLILNFQEDHAIFLIRNGHINPCVKSKEGHTLVHIAACYGGDNVLRYLIEEKKMSLECDGNGNSPLHYAVCSSYGRPKAVSFLIGKCKGQIAQKNTEGMDPFLCVSSYKKFGDILLEKGADINSVDRKGRSSLFYSKKPEEIEFLCSRGANPNHLDNDDCSFLETYIFDSFKSDDSEIFCNLKEVAQILFRYGALIRLDSQMHYILSQDRKYIDFLSETLEELVRGAENDLDSLGQSYEQQLSGNGSVSDDLKLQAYRNFVQMAPFLSARNEELRRFQPGSNLTERLAPFTSHGKVGSLLPSLVGFFLENQNLDVAGEDSEKKSKGMEYLTKLFPRPVKSK